MSTVIKDADAADVTFALVSFNGMAAVAADVSSTATFSRQLETKHTMPAAKSAGRHLIAGRVSRTDSTSGVTETFRVNLTLSEEGKGVITIDDKTDLLALVLNRITGNTSALSLDTVVSQFEQGILTIG